MWAGSGLWSYRKAKLLAIFLVWVTKGLYLSIPGPTMIDIKLIFHASYEEVSRSVSARGVGGFTGALIGGFLVDKFENSLDLIIASIEILSSVAVTYVPFSPDVNFLWFLYFILGICGSVANIAVNRLIILLAKDNTPALIQLLGIGYGVGALLVPLLANPFLAVLEYSASVGEPHSGTHFKVIKESRVHYAFVAIGMASAALSSVFFYFHFKKKHDKYDLLTTEDKSMRKSGSMTFREMINPATYADGSFGFGFYILAVICLFYFSLVGGIEIYSHFIRSFSVDVFKFQKSEASYLNMSFWLTVAISKLFMSLAATYIPVRRLFKLQILFHVISTTIINLYASQSPSTLWLCTIIEGFFASPLYPGAIAYSNTLIDVTGVCLMVITFSGNIGDVVFIWVGGKLYDSYGPTVILRGVQIVGIMHLLCVFLFKIAERQKTRVLVDLTISSSALK